MSEHAYNIVTLALQAVSGIAAAFAAYYGYRNHENGTATRSLAVDNGRKLDEIKCAGALTPSAQPLDPATPQTPKGPT